ncbi:hypothetical protein DV736_g1132, partial [Chaetothyriales sp. CBS 134916]
MINSYTDPSTGTTLDYGIQTLWNIFVTFNYVSYLDLAKYPYLEYSWNLPDVVPEDLLLPFRKFVAKNNLLNITYAIFFNAEGLSDVLDQLTVNVFKYVDASFINTSHGGDVVTAHHKTTRFRCGQARGLEQMTHNGVRLVVKTLTGNKLVRASKLLVGVPPLIDSRRPFDLDNTKRGLFSKW